MGEHEHEQGERQEETSVEAPETPQEPQEEPEAPDTPDEGEEPSETPEEPPPPGRPDDESPEAMEKAFTSLDREAIRHAKRISEILGERALALLPCELCARLLPGFRWPVVDEDQRAAVMLAIGFDPEPDLRADTQSAVCPDCDGWGKVATGSHVQGQKSLDCMGCNGMGWRGPRERIKVTVTTVPEPVVQDNGPQPEPVSDPERDAARRAAEEKGYMVIDTRVPAA